MRKLFCFVAGRGLTFSFGSSVSAFGECIVEVINELELEENKKLLLKCVIIICYRVVE